MGAALEFPVRARRPIPFRCVDVLICGAEDRGDDAAALVAARYLADQLPAGAALRAVGQLDVDDLLTVPPDAAVVVVDAATGIPPGTVVTMPLDGLAAAGSVRPRSSHAIAPPEVIGLATLLRGRPLEGRIVAIGGAQFGLGGEVSHEVARAIPTLVEAVLDAVDHLRS